MAELDGYERNDSYYRLRMDELRCLIRHMDLHCASFCVESDGIRVALVSELLKNALCCHIHETADLLEEYVKPTDIGMIVDGAIEYARDQIGIYSAEDVIANLDMEEEAEWLKREVQKMELEDIAKKIAQAKERPCLDDEKMETAIDPGQEAR